MTESTEPAEALTPTRVLVVDDDPAVVDSLSDLLRAEGFDVASASSGSSALKRLGASRFSVAVVDHFLPDMMGTILLERIKESPNSCPVIMFTGHGSLDSAKAAVNLGAFAYVEKVDPTELLRYVHQAAREHIQRRSESLQAEVDEKVESLRESDARFRTLAEVAPVGIFRTDRQGKYLYVNEQWCSITGRTRDEASGAGWIESVHPDDRAQVANSWRLAVDTGTPFHAEYRLRRKDGVTVWVIGRAAAECVSSGEIIGHIGTVTDITDRKLGEDKLRDSLSEKEILLKEIHHRVKNNLQVVSSLIDLQARSINDPTSARLFDESRNRIKSMALVHEQLYQSHDLGCIEFARYVRELTTHLYSCFGAAPDRVALEFELSPVDLSLEIAIPCGLVINELVSNAFEHAFPQGHDGPSRPRIRVSLGTREADGELVILRVQDNGIGLPDDMRFDDSDTLGLKLVTTLTRQIRGTLRTERERGTTFLIEFRNV